MNIADKIQQAKDYVSCRQGTQEPKDLMNDAANIFADNYEEYLAIWNTLEGEGVCLK